MEGDPDSPPAQVNDHAVNTLPAAAESEVDPISTNVDAAIISPQTGRARARCVRLSVYPGNDLGKHAQPESGNIKPPRKHHGAPRDARFSQP